jgi:putative ABC transport system permease protein
MSNTAQIAGTSITQAFRELKANKLRTFLSLLGITIGIFCIIAVLTVIDGMKNNIQEKMSTLGSDVLYINRKPWVPESGEYKWWEYLQRRPMGEGELNTIKRNVHGIRYMSICFADGVNLKYQDQELEGVIQYGVSDDFEKIQNVDIEKGRYLSASEIEGGTNSVVIGSEVAEELFPPGYNPTGKSLSFLGKKFNIIGVMKKSGENMAGFNFDNSIIYPFKMAKAIQNLSSLDWNNDPIIMVKAENGVNIDDMKSEVEGSLRTIRKVKPGDKNNFSVNQLSQISERLDLLFGTINVVGWVIAGFSLLVGGFGIANIMFVTVKERTKVIGLKKAIGARRRSILLEFLIEAVTLCITGGLIGIVIVLGLSLLLTYGLDFPVSLSLKNFFIGVGISGFVGVLAGFIPARSASLLDPVVAIRSQ